MIDRFVLFEFADNFVVWGIVALALFCYYVEFDLLLGVGERNAQWKSQARTWLTVLPILLGALPSRNRFAPVIPLEPTTMQSARRSSAVSITTWAGSPSST